MFGWALAVLAFFAALHVASGLHLPSFSLTVLSLGFVLVCVGTFVASVEQDRADIRRFLR